MRKTVCVMSLLIAVVALGTSSLCAEGMTFGFKGGLSLAKITGSDVENAGWRTAGVGGLFLSYQVNNIFAIQPEMLYAMKGTTGEEGIVKLTMKLDYFEIPLLAKLYLPTESKVKPNLYAGPAMAFKVSSKLKGEAGSLSAEADLEGIKSTDFGIIVGAGMEYRLTSGCILFDLRYTMGLISIFDVADEADVRNSAVSIMVGYGFAF